MVLAMSIGLLGFFLRTIRNPRNVARPFLIVSVAFLWNPHLDDGMSSAQELNVAHRFRATFLSTCNPLKSASTLQASSIF
jgi:hypothetical protein